MKLNEEGDDEFCEACDDEFCHLPDATRPTEGDDEPECPFCGQKGRHVCHN